MAVLIGAGIKSAILIGVLATWALAIATGTVHWQPSSYSVRDITSTAMQLDIRGALQLGLLEVVFVFLFVDLFDNVGTLLAVGKKAGLFQGADGVPRINRILYSDAIATVAGSAAGTSTVVSYIESAAGVAVGGRSGVTAIVTGLLFAVALFVAPLAGAIPNSATAPALIIVGSMMMTRSRRDRLGRSRHLDPCLPDDDGNPPDLQHRQRPRFRFLLLDADQDLPRPLPRSQLDGLRADRSLPRSFLLALTQLYSDVIRWMLFPGHERSCMNSRHLIVCLALGSLSLPAWAQVSASISGRVEDPSGAGVSGAAITVKSLETGASRSTVTDNSGNYELLSLPLGAQEIKAEKNGFKAVVRTGINLEVGEQRGRESASRSGQRSAAGQRD